MFQVTGQSTSAQSYINPYGESRPQYVTPVGDFAHSVLNSAPSLVTPSHQLQHRQIQPILPPLPSFPLEPTIRPPVVGREQPLQQREYVNPTNLNPIYHSRADSVNQGGLTNLNNPAKRAHGTTLNTRKAGNATLKRSRTTEELSLRPTPVVALTTQSIQTDNRIIGLMFTQEPKSIEDVNFMLFYQSMQEKRDSGVSKGNMCFGCKFKATRLFAGPDGPRTICQRCSEVYAAIKLKWPSLSFLARVEAETVPSMIFPHRNFE